MNIHIKGQPFEVIETSYIKACEKIAEATIANKFNKMGMIVGQPGTGKTIATYYLANKLKGYRFTCHATMTKKSVLATIANHLGTIKATASSDELVHYLIKELAGKLLILDEANHLSGSALESLRYFSDEVDTSIILSGTSILTQTLQDNRNKTYLAQINSRIGSKRVEFKAFGNPEANEITSDVRNLISAYFLKPRNLTSKSNKLVTNFFKYTKGGIWRLGIELLDSCERVMKINNEQELTVDILQIAAREIQLIT